METDETTPDIPTPKPEDPDWIKALKASPMVFANISAVSFNLSDISITYGTQFDNNETCTPGVRVVMTHENFMKHVETLKTYYDLFDLYYGQNRPSLPRDDSPEGQRFIKILKDVVERGTKNDNTNDN